MKFVPSTTLFFLLSLLAKKCSAQGIVVRVPAPGDVIVPGENMTVQIVRPLTMEASTEVGIAIGLLNCPADVTPCPGPESEMGNILYTGSYDPKYHAREMGAGDPYQNFSLYVPLVAEGQETGPASLHIARFYLIGGGPGPVLELHSVPVTIGALPSAPFTIHPAANSKKCVSIIGRYATGSIDIYDCDGLPNQKWHWNERELVSVNPLDQSEWCLEAVNASKLANGVKPTMAPCSASRPEQTWELPATSYDAIALYDVPGYWCLDLSNGNTTNGNALQMWSCEGNFNQKWTFTDV